LLGQEVVEKKPAYDRKKQQIQNETRFNKSELHYKYYYTLKDEKTKKIEKNMRICYIFPVVAIRKEIRK
jgi:hypothetical protein